MTDLIISKRVVVPTPEEIFEASLKDMWFAEDAIHSGTTLSYVDGRLTGLRLSPVGVGLPVYLAVGTGHGKPVIYSAAFQEAGVANSTTVPGTLLPAGTRPHLWMIANLLFPLGGKLFGVYGTSLNLNLTNSSSVVSANYGSDVSSVGMSSGVILISAQIDATLGTVAWSSTNGLGAYDADGTAVTPNAVNHVWVGYDGASGYDDDVEYTCWGVCDDTPAAWQIEALKKWASVHYGPLTS